MLTVQNNTQPRPLRERCLGVQAACLPVANRERQFGLGLA